MSRHPGLMNFVLILVFGVILIFIASRGVFNFTPGQQDSTDSSKTFYISNGGKESVAQAEAKELRRSKINYAICWISIIGVLAALSSFLIPESSTRGNALAILAIQILLYSTGVFFAIYFLPRL